MSSIGGRISFGPQVQVRTKISKTMQKLLTTLVALAFYCSLPAQFLDIGFNFGATFYSGDISNGDIRQMIQEMRPAGGIMVRFSSTNRFSTRFNINYGSIQGDDQRSGRENRDLAFRTDILEANLIGEWHAIRIRHTQHNFTFPYVFGGVGIYRFNPKRQVDGRWVELQPLGTEGQGIRGYEDPYDLTQFQLPFGAGIKFVARNFTICIEAGGRYLFTDYLDDVSSNTVNHRDIYLNNGPLAAQLSNPSLGGEAGINKDYKRGGESQDWLYMMNISVSYNFGEGLHRMLTDPVPCVGW